MAKKPDVKAVILGSGTCVPSLKRSSCSVLAETGGRKILLDAGPGTMRRLLEAGTEIYDVDCLLFSHFHPDHSAELAPFVFSNKYPDAGRRKRPLTVAGGPGFAKFFESLENVYGDWIRLPDGVLKIVELNPDEGPHPGFGPFCLETAPVKHRPESVAFKITGPGGSSLVYSGDTDYSESLVDFASGADLLICESALPDERKVPGHLTPSLAGEIASRAGVSLLVLTHFYPECDGIDIEKQCRKTYNGPLALAEDLMVFELPLN